MIAPSYNQDVIRDIQRYDRQLCLKWNRLYNRWELWRNNNMIVRIENSNGSFRPIDRRLLSYIVNTDVWKMGKDATTIHKDMLYYERMQKEKRENNFNETLVEIGKQPYVRRAFQEQYR